MMTADALVEALNSIRREAEHITGKPIWAMSSPDGDSWVAIMRADDREFVGRGQTVLEASEAALAEMQARPLPLKVGGIEDDA